MNDVTALQARLTNARRDRDRARGAYESAKTMTDTARAELHKEFGVDTVEEAEALARQLSDQLDAEIERLNALLDRIGA